MDQNPAKGIVWDLSDLYNSHKDSKITQDLNQAKEKAEAFEKKYKPFLKTIKNSKSLDKKAPSDLFILIKDLEEITVISTKPYVYAQLLHAAHTNSQEMGAFLQKIQLAITEIRHSLRFWEIEWNALDEKCAASLYSSPELTQYRHYLENLRSYAPHLLGEKEEKIIDIKDNTGVRAFSRLFDEVINNIPFYVTEDGHKVKKTEGEVLALFYSPDREKRKMAHHSLTVGLEKNQRMLTYIMNMIAQDYKATNELRRFSHPMDPRNLANEITLPMVQGLIHSVKSTYGTVERYYALKKKILDLDTLYDYDRYAPVLSEQTPKSWQECRQMVCDTFQEFNPQMGSIAKLFFEKNWIDAEIREGKRGGAFCCETTPDLHPYIFTNYTGKLRDVIVVAHELGHGIHQYLARQVGVLESHGPLTLAETASVFGEILVFDKLLQNTQDPKQQLGLLCGKIEDIFSTVFRQIVLTDFEDKLHEASRQEGELSTERISDLWMQANKPMHGNSVKLTEEYKIWWMYIPHFIHTPFYCYAYSFAQLLVLSLYKKYKEHPEGFAEKFSKMLSLGGSRKPEEICAIMDVDIHHPEFWQSGLSVIQALISRAEDLAKQI